LVLEGLSHDIHATAIRPRIGVWLDTNRVVEVYLDHLKNSTTLTKPVGPTTFGGVSRPGGVDSLQALMPSRMSATSEGAVYGESHRLWTTQWEADHTSLAIREFRVGGLDELQADIYKACGRVLAAGLPGRPFASAEVRSESWEGDSTLGRNIPASAGWTDAQDAGLGIQPQFGILSADADAGLGRSSRMANQVYWLQHYGARAVLDLPLGFGADVGVSSRMQDAEWETLYRDNPARFRYPSPDLKPRTDRTLHGSLSWSLPHVTLDGGLDFFRSEDAWLPRVLPNPDACADLADSLYSGLQSQRCSAPATGSSEAVLPDSLALALRNYGEQRLDAWHLGLALGLGNWTLALHNRFLLSRSVTDAGLARSRQDLSVPARVFKGRLAWKRDLVDGKLHLDLGWDWEWFSTRYVWVPELNGSSKVGKLDEYLVLDFQAAMRIKTFTLYFRSMNMNHDRYATEPGVHPPGLNFRFGVDWTLWN
jgi:hypothetical protein